MGDIKIECIIFINLVFICLLGLAFLIFFKPYKKEYDLTIKIKSNSDKDSKNIERNALVSIRTDLLEKIEHDDYIVIKNISSNRNNGGNKFIITLLENNSNGNKENCSATLKKTANSYTLECSAKNGIKEFFFEGIGEEICIKINMENSDSISKEIVIHFEEKKEKQQDNKVKVTIYSFTWQMIISIVIGILILVSTLKIYYGIHNSKPMCWLLSLVGIFVVYILIVLFPKLLVLFTKNEKEHVKIKEDKTKKNKIKKICIEFFINFTFVVISPDYYITKCLKESNISKNHRRNTIIFFNVLNVFMTSLLAVLILKLKKCWFIRYLFYLRIISRCVELIMSFALDIISKNKQSNLDIKERILLLLSSLLELLVLFVCLSTLCKPGENANMFSFIANFAVGTFSIIDFLYALIKATFSILFATVFVSYVSEIKVPSDENNNNNK